MTTETAANPKLRGALPRLAALGLALALAACNSVGGTGVANAPEVAEPSSEAPPRAESPPRAEIPPRPTRRYTLFFDQGDHLEELIKDREYLEAARLIDRERAYFAKDAEDYAEDLVTIVNALNEEHEPALHDALVGMKVFTWPAPEPKWLEIGDALRAAQTALVAYGDVPLLSEKAFRSGTASTLGLKVTQARRRLDRAAIETFILYDHFADRSFFDQWPVALDAAAFMSEHFNKLGDRMALATTRDLQRFLAHYPRDAVQGPDIFSKLSNHYVAAFLRELGANKTDLRAVLTAFKVVSDLGFAPTAVPGVTIGLIQSTTEAADFPVTIETDLPLIETATAAPGQASSHPLAQAVDILITFDVTGATAERQVDAARKISSTYQTGTRMDINPAFVMARKRVILARGGDMAESLRADGMDGDGGADDGVRGFFSGDPGPVDPADFDGALDDLLTTPPTTEVPDFRVYEFERLRLDASKTVSALYTVTDKLGHNRVERRYGLRESRRFDIAAKVKDSDPRRDEYFATASSEAELKDWESAPLTIKLSDVIEHYLSN
jgi:hypothetical protein